MNFKPVLFKIMLFSLVIFSGCEKDRETENISTITYFPTIQLNGDQWNTIKQGGAWSDQGATANEGESSINLITTGSVDVNTPGVYTIQYTAINKDGFSASEYRYIGVISPSVEGKDISGQYKRNAGALGVSTVTKISDNFYYSNNVGGVAVPDPSLGVYFYHYDTGLLDVPFQRTPGNAFECLNETITEGEKYSWVVINSGYGAALRTFIKQ
ncbi:MAG: DUF5011 domain-containing protein [Saprospiraceae bacterium]|nr:DUF5011 domain-containing protein [Saprospiraceae bacterium]